MKGNDRRKERINVEREKIEYWGDEEENNGG